MEVLWLLWGGFIPSIPLVLTHGNIIAAGTDVALLLCTVALWLEREHPAPEPRHCDSIDGDMRLAA